MAVITATSALNGSFAQSTYEPYTSTTFAGTPRLYGGADGIGSADSSGGSARHHGLIIADQWNCTDNYSGRSGDEAGRYCRRTW